MAMYGIGTLPLVKSMRPMEPAENDEAEGNDVVTGERADEDEELEGEVSSRRRRRATRSGEDERRVEDRRKELLKEAPENVARRRQAEGRSTPGSYADDVQVSGRVSQCIATFNNVLTRGPAYGIKLLSVGKTKLVVKEKDLARA
jgi:hypothetical protein